VTAALNFRELAAQILFVSGKDSNPIAAAKRQGAVTVEFDFINPIAWSNGFDQLRLHWLDEIGYGRGGYYPRDLGNTNCLTADRRLCRIGSDGPALLEYRSLCLRHVAIR
jgi:hypothetical protein